MRVINLLPWRDGVYRKRCRNFLVMLLVVIMASGICAGFSYRSDLQDRREYHAHVTHLNKTLLRLEHDHLLLQQTSVELMDVSEKLQSRLHHWKRQREWRQLTDEWQLLADDADISGIRWQGNRLLLSGVSDAANPLRQLINKSPQWQLETIELNAQNRFQFRVSRTMQSEGGI